MGVLILAPIVLVAFATPRNTWRSRWRTVAIPLAATFTTATILFFYATVQERKRTELEFGQLATRLHQRLEETLNDYLDVVNSVESLYISSNDVERDEFRTFNGRLLAIHPGITSPGERPS